MYRRCPIWQSRYRFRVLRIRLLSRLFLPPSTILQAMADTPLVKPTLQDHEPTETEPLLPRHDSGPETPVKRRSLWAIGMYVALSVASAIALGFFIQGWIAAGDVKVSQRILSPMSY